MTKVNQTRRRKSIPEKKKKQNEARHKFSYYVTEVLVIGTVVAAALFLPQLIFRVEDNILCNDTALGKRESMNVAALSTAYEKSLAARMNHFAQGLAENKKYYATSQELTVNDELKEYLYSDRGFYQDYIQVFLYYLVPFEIWEDYYSVVSWKRYVIYSENFEEGVNFILWYIELQDNDGGKFKLLTDAEDGTIYAIKTEDSSLSGSGHYYKEFIEMLRYGDRAIEAWAYFALYYKALSDDRQDVFAWAEQMGIDMRAVSEADSGSYDAEIGIYNEDEVKRQILKAFSYQNEDESRIRFLIPYGDNELDAVLYIEEREKKSFYLFPNVTAGIRQIYEMIPEFA